MPKPSRRGGLMAAIGSYGLWGTLPIYFSLMPGVAPVEVVGWRILLSLVLCLPLALLIPGSRAALRELARDRRMLAALAAAGACIAVNWFVYVYAAWSHRTIDAALGYFLNPLVSVALGTIVLRERLRPLQIAAVAVAFAGFIAQLLAYGQLPWIAACLAVSFACYGLIKKRAGVRLDPLAGFTAETALLAPLGAACLAWAGLAHGGLGIGEAPVLLLAGLITSLPLLLFAVAARTLTLVEIGIAQYLAPSVQLLLAVLVLGETMPAERWAGFALVWVALVLFTFDMIRSERRGSSG